jgi:hypothetical protein
MNRSLWIPAGACLAAFAGLLVVLHAVTGREKAADFRQTAALMPRSRQASPALRGERAIPNALAAGETMLSIEESKQHLTALTGEYLRPWRQWESSPARLYSRIALRPVPTIFADVDVPSDAAGPADSFLVATIALRKGDEVESVPCVVNRLNKQARLFANGRWLTEDEWLELAPVP